MTLCKFEKIQIPLPDRNILGTDQKYLYDIHQAISEGICDDRLSRRSPGKIGHARWLTTANRILRLYVSSEDPSDEI